MNFLLKNIFSHRLHVIDLKVNFSPSFILPSLSIRIVIDDEKRCDFVLVNKKDAYYQLANINFSSNGLTNRRNYFHSFIEKLLHSQLLHIVYGFQSSYLFFSVF